MGTVGSRDQSCKQRQNEILGSGDCLSRHGCRGHPGTHAAQAGCSSRSSCGLNSRNSNCWLCRWRFWRCWWTSSCYNCCSCSCSCLCRCPSSGSPQCCGNSFSCYSRRSPQCPHHPLDPRHSGHSLSSRLELWIEVCPLCQRQQRPFPCATGALSYG